MSATRSKQKTREEARAAERRRWTTYSDEQREAALEAVKDAGIAAAHDATGIPKATLSRWARAAGISLSAQARARTANATAAHEARTAELALDTASRLERVLGMQLDALEDLAGYEAEATEALRNLDDAPIWADVTDLGYLVLRHREERASQTLARLKLLKDAVSKRDLVGAVGLSVDKLELLRGKATERGELIVRFGIPRPDFAKADREAIDLPPRED